jgi:hypothetical protein
MIQAPDPLWFPLINEFARDTPWPLPEPLISAPS